MQATIISRYSHLNDTEAGREAVQQYLAAISREQSHAAAETLASNVLQRAGYGVNRTGGVTIASASIDHNDEPGTRVYLVIDHDAQGFFVATLDDEDTGPRFATAAEAYESISQRWGAADWALELL